MKFRTLCICVVAVVALIALLLLFYFLRPSVTGAVSTGICPPGSTPILAEGAGVYLKEIAWYERLGHKCFFGYDGITPCCFRTSNCCPPYELWQQNPSVGTAGLH
ncbi:MAG: hypothetical protein QXR48_00160 [Candidatus Woesearchaeota archaeon]